MVVCDLCTGRHRTGACGKAAVFVEQCFTSTPDDFDPSTIVKAETDRLSALEEEFAWRRQRVAAEREAWEAERAERLRTAHQQRTRRHRSGLRLVS